jgi:hypothetical protein
MKQKSIYKVKHPFAQKWENINTVSVCDIISEYGSIIAKDIDSRVARRMVLDHNAALKAKE